MSEFEPVTRREMLSRSGRTAAGVGLGLALGSRLSALAQSTPSESANRVKGANDRIVLALIGAGGQGRADMNGLMGKTNVEIAAVCDVDQIHMAQAAEMVEKKSGRRPREMTDFRDVLAMKDVDGVIIGTPDHWHALPFILACEAGKDVFCEKPISHNIVEGRRMVDAAAKFKRVVQINTWQRSTQHFVDAIDYVRSGKLGKVALVRSWKTDNQRAGQATVSTPPAALDYDFWVGPAAWEPYQENRCHYRFRWYWNYAAGMTGDWGVHMMDVALLGMAKDDILPMPLKVSAGGGKLVAPDDDRTTPDTHLAVFQFDGWLLHWETHAGSYGLDGGGDHGTEFIGTDARLIVDRGGWKVFDKAGKEVPRVESTRRVSDHNGDFLDAMRTRGMCRSGIASMHQTTTVCHLANLAYLAGHTIEWDAEQEKVTNDKRAMELLPYRRPYRKPWTLPNHRA